MKILLRDENRKFELVFQFSDHSVVVSAGGDTFLRDRKGNPVYAGIDINTEVIKELSDTLNNLISYRIAEYDSTELILSLLKKLPEKKRQELLKNLKNQTI